MAFSVGSKISATYRLNLDSKNAAAYIIVGGCFHLFGKWEFGGQWPLTMRYGPRRSIIIFWAPRPVACLALRMEFGKLEFDELKNTLVIFNHGTKTYNKSKNNTNNQNSSSN